MRANLGDTQEAFAERLGLSKRAIANYEKDRRPTAGVLARLAKAASDAGMGAETSTFMLELGHDLGLGEIKGAVMSRTFGNRPTGFMLAQFEGRQALIYAKAFLETYGTWLAGSETEKKRAEQLLSRFANSVAEKESRP